MPKGLIVLRKRQHRFQVNKHIYMDVYLRPFLMDWPTSSSTGSSNTSVIIIGGLLEDEQLGDGHDGHEEEAGWGACWLPSSWLIKGVRPEGDGVVAELDDEWWSRGKVEYMDDVVAVVDEAEEPVM